MLRLAWRGILARPVRFLLSALAVVLGIAFVTGTLALRTSLADTFGDITSGSYQADLYVGPPADAMATAGGMPSSTGVPLSAVDEIDRLPGVDRAEPALQGSGVLIGADDAPVVSAGAPTIVLDAAGIGDSMSVAGGRLPTTADEIALETSSADRAGLSIGDRTKLVLGSRIEDVEVVGEFAYDGALFGAVMVAIDHSSAVDVFAPDGIVTTIGVYAEPAQDLDELTDRVADALGSDVEPLKGDLAGDGVSLTTADGTTLDVRTAASMRADLAESIDDIIGFVSVFLVAFGALALLIGGFLIANTFTMSVRQRMHEIAVLRSIGASPPQVFGEIVGQAALVGLVGAVVGIAAGMGLIAVVSAVFAAMGLEMSGEASLTGTTVAIAIVLGVGVSAVSAAVPAARAARIPPIEAMSESIRSEAAIGKRTVVGTVVLAAGIAAALYGWAIAADGAWVLGVGVAAVLVGALLIAPALIRPVVGVLGWPLARTWAPIGVLAQRNVARTPRRSAATAGALMIGMALVAGCAVLAASVQASFADIVTTQARADFMVQNAQQEALGVPQDAVDEISSLPGAGEVDILYLGMAAVDGAPVTVVSATAEGLSRSFDLPMLHGTADALGDGELLISESFADENDLRVGDEVDLAPGAASSAGARAIRVGGVLDENSFIGVPAIVPPADFEAVVPPGGRVTDMLMVTAAPGADEADLRAALEEIVQPYYVIAVRTGDDLVGSLSQQVTSVLTLLYALLALSVVIAVLGILNTLALAIIERQRELGLLRAVGLGRGALASTVFLESVYLALFGGVLGLLLGTGLAALLPRVLASRGFDQLAVPWGQLAAMVSVVVIAGVVAAVCPALRAVRTPVLQAIAAE